MMSLKPLPLYQKRQAHVADSLQGLIARKFMCVSQEVVVQQTLLPYFTTAYFIIDI